MSEYAVEMRGITKIFGTNRANDRVDFSVRKGSIHGLLGENGAGKTTLMNVLFGLYAPEEGKILIDGAEQVIDSPTKAISLGIGMVHQHFMLARPLTVTENVMLGKKSRRGILLDTKQTAAERIRSCRASPGKLQSHNAPRPSSDRARLRSGGAERGRRRP